MRAAAEDTRERILHVARDHFRTYGYAKTTVADIAKACGMSPANVYRFFPNKVAIVEATAAQWLAEVEHLARAIAERPVSAAERLEAYFVEVHEATLERFFEQSKIHETCVMVIDNHWPVVDAYVRRLSNILSIILADGLESGEFSYDGPPMAMAMLVMDATVLYHHPTMVEQFHGRGLATAALKMSRLLICALRAGVAREVLAPHGELLTELPHPPSIAETAETAPSDAA